MGRKAVFAHAYGDAAAAGRQLGKQLSAEIHATLKAFDIPDRFADDAHRRLLDGVLENISRLAPHLIEEMDGIADGAGVEREAIYMLNCVAELSVNWCSLVALADAPGGPAIGKTADLPPAEPHVYAVQAVEVTGKPQMLRIGWPGTVWAIDGVSEQGLAVATASVSTAERRSDGIPSNFAGRLVLEGGSSVDEAIELLAELPIAARPLNMAIADGDRAVVVERSVYKMAVREPRDGIVCATNHFLNPDLAELLDASQQRVAESQARLQRLCELAGAGEHTRQRLAQILAHHGPPAVCRHDGALVTVAAAILRPRARVLWYAAGPPCEAPMRPFQLRLPVTGGGGIVGYAT